MVGRAILATPIGRMPFPQHCSREQPNTRLPLGEQCTLYILDNVDLKVHRKKKFTLSCWKLSKTKKKGHKIFV